MFGDTHIHTNHKLTGHNLRRLAVEIHIVKANHAKVNSGRDQSADRCVTRACTYQSRQHHYRSRTPSASQFWEEVADGGWFCYKQTLPPAAGTAVCLFECDDVNAGQHPHV
jgi:hypothetical protein